MTVLHGVMGSTVVTLLVGFNPRERRGASPDILPGVYTLENPPLYLAFVQFYKWSWYNAGITIVRLK